VAREKSLFEGLARRFYAGVYNYLCWVSRDKGLAEDLTQETFMRIWQHPPEMRGERALKSWVFRVARNEYLQHRRRVGLETVTLDDGTEIEGVILSGPGPQLSLERQALRRAVRGAVEKLPDPYREVVVLHNLEGLSLSQIAEVLGIPVGTVKSRRAKALSLLRELLQEVGSDEL
jgi:RNA polymerase sigma-70 factor (ECF subfamily)